MSKPVQNLFRRQREEWIAEGRRVAERLLLTRETITSEDVIKIHPLPSYLHPNAIGRIFSSSEVFKPVGYTVAKHTAAHGRIIRIWALDTSLYPESMLARRRAGQEFDDGR